MLFKSLFLPEIIIYNLLLQFLPAELQNPLGFSFLYPFNFSYQVLFDLQLYILFITFHFLETFLSQDNIT